MNIIKITNKPENEIRKNRKEKSFYKQYSAINLNTGKTLVTVRCYGAGSVSYACAWITSDEFYTRGSGKAGGGGYHKESASIAYALADAGVEFDHNEIAGRGDSAVKESLRIICEYINPKYKVIIHCAHA